MHAGKIERLLDLFLVDQQARQHGRRCNRVVDLLVLQLRQEHHRVERMMQDHQVAQLEPVIEEPADGRHVDEGKRVQHDVVGHEPHRVFAGQGRRQPVIMAARHALRRTRGAGRPADREDIVGVLDEPRYVLGAGRLRGFDVLAEAQRVSRAVFE